MAVLLIEDEAAIADAVVFALESEGFQVHWCTLGQEGIALLERDAAFTALILDVGLPDQNGFEVCKTIRRFSDIPIIFLTARNEEVDRIVGLEIGGDDYVCKPFSPRELAARVKAIHKRLPKIQSKQQVSSDDAAFNIDRDRACVQYRGEVLDLTRYEYLILLTLLGQPQRVFSRAQIMEQVWEQPETSLERAVDTHIKSLRGKLKSVNSNADPITTHRGLGYSINGSVSES